jgi:hypothetical protein
MSRTSTIRAGAVVPFTRDEPEEPTESVFFKAPTSLKAYLDKHGVKRTILRAVAFDRDVGELLAPMDERVVAFAKAQGLSMERDAAKVLALLAQRGLDSWDAEQRKKK